MRAAYKGAVSLDFWLSSRTALAIALVVVVVGFAYFVPIIYVPAVVPVCNVLCSLSGQPQYYASISFRLIGQGATHGGLYGDYHLTTPFGGFDLAV
jgi:hypothetical protein